MFNLAIDSKLRACDLTALKVDHVAMSGRVKSRSLVVQKKTGRPVQFEIAEQTTDTLVRWIEGDYWISQIGLAVVALLPPLSRSAKLERSNYSRC